MDMLTSFIIFLAALATFISLTRYTVGKYWGVFDALYEEDLRGRVIIITGASSGLGLATALELAKRNALVIVTARTLEKARQAMSEIIKKASGSGGNGELIPMELDLARIESIKQFHEKISRSFKSIDILINNAGVLQPIKEGVPLKRTEDGHEIHFGVNHLGHFLLTNLLMPLLEKSENSRIIILTSSVYKKGKLNFQDLNWEREIPPKSEQFGDYPLYNMSKLANVLFAKELGKRLARTRTGVRVYTLCPGIVRTNIGRHISIFSVPFRYIFFELPFARLMMKTAWQGCQTVLYCAISQKCGFESGMMYKNSDLWRRGEYFPDALFMTIPPHLQDDTDLLSDENMIALWDESEKLVQMKFPVF